MRSHQAGILFMAMLVPHALPAADNPQGQPSAIDPEKYTSNLLATRKMPSGKQGAIKFVSLIEGGAFNTGSWHPGREFKNGDNWLALACTKEQCAFEPAALAVKKEGYVGPYDLPDQPAPGQRLSFKKMADSPGAVIAWFQIAGAYPWIKPGPVVTYYPVGTPLKIPGGTMEAALQLPNGESATFVPMVLPPGVLPPGAPIGLDSYPPFYLQLRSNGKRQLLPGVFGGCTTSVAPGEYLQWAGDMDGDGKPDYLISWITTANQGGGVDLYLSGLARPGQLVGLAGAYDVPSGGGEC